MPVWTKLPNMSLVSGEKVRRRDGHSFRSPAFSCHFPRVSTLPGAAPTLRLSRCDRRTLDCTANGGDKLETTIHMPAHGIAWHGYMGEEQKKQQKKDMATSPPRLLARGSEHATSSLMTGLASQCVPTRIVFRQPRKLEDGGDILACKPRSAGGGCVEVHFADSDCRLTR